LSPDPHRYVANQDVSVLKRDPAVDGMHEAPTSRLSIRSGLLLTAGAWLVSHVVVGISDAQARNPLALKPAAWARWDSLNYLEIARHGTTFGRCDSPRFAGFFNPYGQTWCGTAGWLPGYPWTIRVLQSSDFNRAALLISWVALAIAIFLVWYGWGRDLSHGRAFLVLLLFALFPGAVYNFAIFPTSMALAFVVGALIAAVRERFVLCALLMTGAGLCYPSAWFAAGGLAVALVAVAYHRKRTDLVRRAVCGLLGLSSVLILTLISHPWNAFFLADRQKGVQAEGFPGQDLLRLVFTHGTTQQRNLGQFYGSVLSVQALITVALVAAAGVIAYVSWRRRGPDVSLVYPAAVGIAVVLVVTALNSQGGAWNRSVVLAAPCVVCFRRVPLAALCAMVVGVGVVSAVLSATFFDGRLV
jgi:hypothetical protein